jgi:hypothetical protein
MQRSRNTFLRFTVSATSSRRRAYLLHLYVVSLTAAQQTQASTIFTNEQTAHTSLTAAVKANQTAYIDTVATQLGFYEAQIANIRSKAPAVF